MRKRETAGGRVARGTQAERERGTAVASDGERYSAYADGAVWDKQSGLEWKAGPDSDTNYDQAVSWVAGLGGGWRMPTRAELRTLYMKGAGDSNMTPLLKTTGLWVWAEPEDGSSAWYFTFANGDEGTFTRGLSNFGRGFAVRVRPGR